MASSTPASIINATKVAHYDDQLVTNEQIEKLAKKAQAIQIKIQNKRQAAQEALTAQVKPLQSQLDGIQQEVNRLTAEFNERDRVRKVEIETLEKVVNHEPSTD